MITRSMADNSEPSLPEQYFVELSQDSAELSHDSAEDSWIAADVPVRSEDSASTDNECCAICQDALRGCDAAVMIQDVHTLPCDHSFHAACMLRAVLASGHGKCPLCRNDAHEYHVNRMRSKLGKRMREDPGLAESCAAYEHARMQHARKIKKVNKFTRLETKRMQVELNKRIKNSPEMVAAKQTYVAMCKSGNVFKSRFLAARETAARETAAASQSTMWISVVDASRLFPLPYAIVCMDHSNPASGKTCVHRYSVQHPKRLRRSDYTIID